MKSFNQRKERMAEEMKSPLFPVQSRFVRDQIVWVRVLEELSRQHIGRTEKMKEW